MTTPAHERVTILTPTIPGREALLAEAAASVAAQTEPVHHLTALDEAGRGPALTRNALLEEVETPFVGFLDDDDLLDPVHVASLMAQFTGEVDVAWPRCRTVFGEGVAPIRVMQPIRVDYLAMCKGGRNYIPVTVIARTETIRGIGGFNPLDRYEDFSLWCRMIATGAVFVHVPVVTWTYRFLGANRTFA